LARTKLIPPTDNEENKLRIEIIAEKIKLKNNIKTDSPLKQISPKYDSPIRRASPDRSAEILQGKVFSNDIR
jgi:hypothetical protein